MTAGTWDFTIEEGVTFRRVLTWEEPAGSPVNLTGFTSRLVIHEMPNPAVLIWEMTDGNGITLGGAAGTITLEISAANTAALDFVKAVHDLVMTSSGGIVTRLLEGAVFYSGKAGKVTEP